MNDYQKNPNNFSPLPPESMLGYTTSKLENPCRIPLIEREQKNLSRLLEQVERSKRIMELLEKHPEYEEYDQLKELMQYR